MGMNKVTIDVEARFVDNLSGQAGRATKTIDDLDKKAKTAQKDLDKLSRKKSKPIFDADNSKLLKKLREAEAKADKLGKKKTKTVLEVVDKATNKIGNVMNKAQAFANKIYTTAVKIKDSEAVQALAEVTSKARSFASKTWEAMVKVKDMATAPLTKIKNMLFSIKSLVLAITAGMAAKTFIASPVNLADTYAGALAGFQTQLGQKEGQKMMDDLQKFAAKTPFNATGVIQNATSMIAQGFDAKDMINTMQIIGDAAASTGQMNQGMERIMRALGQIKTAGTIQGDEMNQLAEAGIPAYQILADELGFKSIADYRKAQKGGQVSSDQAIEALLRGMQKRYSGMMDQMATKTFSGVMSNIGDTLQSNVWLKWGQGLQSGGIRALTSITKLLDASESKLKKLGDTLYEIGQTLSNWAADKFEGAMNRLMKVVDSEEFDNASLGEKISMIWKGVVSDPLAEWWSNGGQQKTATTAGKIGAWLGKTMSNMLLGLFGATKGLDNAGLEGGASIAESFVRGFVDNFDAGAITKAFVDAIGNIWSALPWWAKLFVGGKVAANAGSMLGNIKGLIGSSAAGTGLIGTIGSTGNAMVRGSGALGGLAGLGYAVKGGAATAAMSGGAAAAIGGGTVLGAAGGLYGLYTGGKGIYEMYKGSKENDQTAVKAGAAKTGGVLAGAGAGAAAGAALGSVIPVLGTLVGGLIGAGVGAGAGALLGNSGASKIKKDAAEAIGSLSELQAEAKKSSEASDVFAKRQEAAAKVLSKSFGDLKLSFEEVDAVAKHFTIGDKAKELDKFSSAAQDAADKLSTFESTTNTLNKWNWKASLGFEFSKTDKESYKEAVQEYITSAQESIEAQHYQFKAAVDLLLEPKESKSILKNGDTFYAGLQKELDTTSTKLTKKIDIALKDGKIDTNEAEIIEKLQTKVSEITKKISEAEQEAKLETLKIKFGSGQLDEQSYQQLQSQIQSYIKESTESYDTALTASITSLNLQYPDGGEAYNEAVKKLTEGYQAEIGEIKANAASVQIDIIGDSENMKDILGEDAKAKLQGALNESLKTGIKPVEWSTEQMATILNTPNLSQQAGDAIAKALTSISETIPATDVTIDVNPTVKVAEDAGSKAKEAISGKIDEKYEFNTEALIKPNYNAEKFEATKSKFGIQDSYSYSTSVKVTVNWNYDNKGKKDIKPYRGGLVGKNVPYYAPGYSDGGMVRGGPQLATLAEEGTPEMVIPLGSQRRERGIKLWEKAGQMLGVPGFAQGGIAGARSQDEGLRYQQYQNDDSAGSQSVQVDVGGVTVEIQVDASKNENIVEAIKAQGNEIANTVAGILADAFDAQFANTATR